MEEFLFKGMFVSMAVLLIPVLIGTAALAIWKIVQISREN